MKRAKFFILMLTIAACLAAAAPAAASPLAEASVVGAGSESEGLAQRGARLFGMTLVFVILGCGVVLWNRKRGGAGIDSSIRVVAVKSLGQREKVAILDIHGERMVVGITAHRISLLQRAAAPASPEAGKSLEKAGGQGA